MQRWIASTEKFWTFFSRMAHFLSQTSATGSGLSQTPCWKRIQRLEAEGVIQRRVALLDAEKLGLSLTVFVCIEAGDHTQDAIKQFIDAIATMDEVVEFHRMAGDVDYMLRVVVSDVKAYDLFYKRLIEIVPLKKVSSRFSVERVKSTTALPIQTTV